MIRLIIAGGRDFTDHRLMDTMFLALFPKECVVLIPSATNKMGSGLANRYSLDAIEYDSYMEEELMQNATHLLAFWDGKSKGTKHMIDIANKEGLSVHVINY
jgi:hypothetical protein